jgi:hypothetical protein
MGVDMPDTNQSDSDKRKAMNAALKDIFIPALRAVGFKGSFPHFHRVSRDSLHLLTLQFDKWGGGFIIEIAKCPNKPFITSWGEAIPPVKITAHDLYTNQRHRIQPRPESGVDSWFRFDDGGVEDAAREAVANLPQAEAWWKER